MVFMPRLIFVLTLFILYHQHHLISAERVPNSTTSPKQNDELNRLKKKFNFTDEDVEESVAPFKFAKNATTNATIKLKQSESYASTTNPSKSAKQNGSRSENGRSIDIDVDAISSNLHNTVYATNEEPTTPKSPYKKYKEAVDSIGQKLDQFDDVEVEEPRKSNGETIPSGNLTNSQDDKNPLEAAESYETGKYFLNDLNKGDAHKNLKFLNDNEVKKDEKPQQSHQSTAKNNHSVSKLKIENDEDILNNKISIGLNSSFAKTIDADDDAAASSRGNNEQIILKNHLVPTVPLDPAAATRNDSNNSTTTEQTQQSTTVFVFVDPDTITSAPTSTTDGEEEAASITTTPSSTEENATDAINAYTTEDYTTDESMMTTTEYSRDDVDYDDLFGRTEIVASTPKGFTLENAEVTTLEITTSTTEGTDYGTTTLPPPTSSTVQDEVQPTTTTTTTTIIATKQVPAKSKEIEHSKLTTTTESLEFVHVESDGNNHTTLLPDILKSKDVYATPTKEQNDFVSAKTTTATTPMVPIVNYSAATKTDVVTEESTIRNSELDNDGDDESSDTNGTIVAIVISCVGGICLIVLAGLLIVMRNRQKRFNYGQRCRPVSLDDYSVDNVSVFNSVRRKNALRGSKRSYGNPAFEDPVCVSHPLNFPSISKFASNAEDVHAEFHEIPQIIARTSELPDGCETKNRYANVIPLPESRVFLNKTGNGADPNSDYINANYVAGPRNTRRYYIACQAPMSNTVDDFWRMVWEQQSKVILMLTHLFENGVEKCFDYLPPSEVSDCHRLFGDYQVTLKKREVKEKYIISSIQLKNMVSNSWREVMHFWYMGWPEKGVPSEANSIIAFLIEARSCMKTTATLEKKATNLAENGGSSSSAIPSDLINPVIVHCSPGTGRTGVAITCDIAIREFEQTRQVDIPKIVYKIRRDRASAVQTKEQYAFIYKVIDLYATKLAGGNLESI